MSMSEKILALSCGTKNGNCETFIRAAAMGAQEFGVETEIIRAMDLKVLPFPGSAKDDDVPWILEKTCVEDYALIVAVPCYHVRANGIFYSINERMNPLFGRNMNILKKTRVGAVIGVGGSGYDGWASLTNVSTQIFIQHTHKLVDQIQVNFCGLREWNLWMQQGGPLTSNTHKARVIDTPYENARSLWGEQVPAAEFFRTALERAKELGRNVARAMKMPIEEVEYKGEESMVSCPVCHSNVLIVPEDLPYVGCPVCWIRGVITTDGGKMKIDWNMEDVKLPRFSHDGVAHHLEWLQKDGERRRKEQKEIDELKKSVGSYGEVIAP
jgi:multimeric flavodoxin WrbA